MNAVRLFGRPRVGVGAAFIFLHLLFSVRSALPGVVFCHRTDGRVVLEFENLDARCSCTECEHCFESRVCISPTTDARMPALHACHCQHELFVSDIGQSFVRLPDRFYGFAPASTTAEIGIFDISNQPRGAAPALCLLPGDRRSGPGSFPLLRC